MPKLGSNRVQYQKRQTRRDNLMSGPGRRFEAEEKTRIRKVEKALKYR